MTVSYTHLVIKNVQNKTLTDVARESKDLVARAREGRLAPEEYSDCLLYTSPASCP